MLAAGAGARLRPLSTLLPKALCPVGGVALVDLAVERARSVTSHVAVNVHHGRALVEAHLEAATAIVRLSVEEPEALGTAGALGRLKGWIAGRGVLIVNADAWHRGDLRNFAGGWDGRRTRLLTVVDPRRGTWSDRRYAGAALLPWSEISRLDDRPSGLWETSWRRLVPGGDLDLVGHDGAFFDCGTPADYLAANLEASGGRSVLGEGAVVEGTVDSTVVWPGSSAVSTCIGPCGRPPASPFWFVDFRGRQLAAGGVDVRTAVAPNRCVDAEAPEPIAKGPDAGRSSAQGEVAGRGVEGDEVHVGGEGVGEGGQFVGVGVAVVYRVDQGPFEREATTLGLPPGPARVEEHGKGPPPVDRHQLVA